MTDESPEDDFVSSICDFAWYPECYTDGAGRNCNVTLAAAAHERAKWKAGIHLLYDVMANGKPTDRERLLRSIGRDLQAMMELYDSTLDKEQPPQDHDITQLISEMPTGPGGVRHNMKQMLLLMRKGAGMA